MAQPDKQILSGINAGFQKYFGRKASKAELSYYSKPGRYSKLQGNLLGDKKNLLPQYQAQPVGKAPVNTDSGTTNQTPSLADFLKGYLPSQETLNAEYDPFYQKQLGGLDYEKQLAQEQLGRNTDITNQNVGQDFNDRGLFGSGIYTQELNRQLGNLNRGFEQEYGAGEYTPYNMRRQQVLQNQLIAKAEATNQNTQQGTNAYFAQYLPQLYNQ